MDQPHGGLAPVDDRDALERLVHRAPLVRCRRDRPADAPPKPTRRGRHNLRPGEHWWIGDDDRVTTIAAGVLDVHVSGPSEGPPVLLLHGFPQGADSWDAVLPALHDAGYRTIAPDQRGYSPGARPTGRAAYRLPELTSDALAVIADRAGGRAHIVGHDWGAAVAWRLAARYPDAVRSLTAVSVPPTAAFARSLVTSRQVLASWYMGAFQIPWLPERLLRPDDRGYSPRLSAALRRTGQTRERARRDAARLADPAALTAALGWYRGILASGARDADPAVTVPTLFVWSDGDTALTRQSTELAHRYVTGPYSYAELHGVSHWVPEEAPEQFAELLLAHLAAYPG
ncbi:alpha/beta fold hydrolase [Pseudonocardia sp. KRD-169]|uniref:Alpha/beta fold hydrolase n=1 Tax=Pseudonocardia abyssalis TaxID=2792008 RepID=A0ABS6UV74_9PSEU|nr:alpha/beta fold hydrolase [Pseudonocardia abyssalis]MBW0136149.1 alpha/beta fold hydrolase [Pseudonocardia abyssalis]